MQVEELSLNAIKPYEKNPRRNDAAVSGVAESIRQFGFQQPLVVDKNNIIVVGHTRYKAAVQLGLKTVPCVRADKLTSKQVKAYRILDNKLNELAEWDIETLGEELAKLKKDFAVFGVYFPPIQLPENVKIETFKEEPHPDGDVLVSPSNDEGNNVPSAPNNQPNDISQRSEWVNMPQIHNENVLGKYYDLFVVFHSLERKIEMGKILGIPINESTSYIYYPEPPEADDTTKVGYR